MHNVRKTPTMADIARVTGFSPMTVSRAFKSGGAVGKDTRDAILAAAEDLGYVFDATAASLRSQRTDFVAVTIPSINNANFADTLRGLSEGLAGRGLQTLLGYTNYDIDVEERLIEQLLRRRPQAIVVTGGRHTARGRRLLANSGVVVVEIWDLPPEPIGHVVGFSNAATMQTMVDHLVASGYRRIAFIGGDDPGDTRGADRRAGFVAAMNGHGLDARRLVAAGKPPISMREGADAMGRLLQAFPDSEAAICVSDLSAFGALTECQRRGVAVPQQVAICGFGDYEIAGICVPGLTTINAFAARIGAQTAQVILDALDGKLAAPKLVRVEPQLILRQSSRHPAREG